MTNGVFLYGLLVFPDALCVLLWPLISLLALAIALANIHGSIRMVSRIALISAMSCGGDVGNHLA
jgi:hypothetical protein